MFYHVSMWHLYSTYYINGPGGALQFFFYVVSSYKLPNDRMSVPIKFLFIFATWESLTVAHRYQYRRWHTHTHTVSEVSQSNIKVKLLLYRWEHQERGKGERERVHESKIIVHLYSVFPTCRYLCGISAFPLLPVPLPPFLRRQTKEITAHI